MQPDIPDTDDDLFASISADTSLPSASNESVIDEVDRYLANAVVTMTSLLNYPHLVEAFLKYNSPLPSSAAVNAYLAVLGKYWYHVDVKCLTQCFRNWYFCVTS